MTTQSTTPSSLAASSPAGSLRGFRGAMIDCGQVAATTHDASETTQPIDYDSLVRYIEDALLIVDLTTGRIVDWGSYESIGSTYLPQLLEEVVTYPAPYVMMPGMIDTHIHYPQTEMIASYGEQLLDWLNRYTFPTEIAFNHDPVHAARVADLFLDFLLQNGTTSALVFATSSPVTVDAFFTAAQARHVRMLCGQVWMDRNAPQELLNTEEYVEQTRALIQKWHGTDRLLYAVTPRFAITSTPKQLLAAGALLQEDPTLYLHTHLSENTKEVAFVHELFPESRDYLDVYDQAGLVRPRSVFAHGVHLHDDEVERLVASDAAISHCPTSNLFLGSGLLPLHRFEELPGASQSSSSRLRVGLGTDIGAGTSFSLLQTAAEAYKVARLQGRVLKPSHALYLLTLGGARALHLDHLLGSFHPGKEADFVVLNLEATPLLRLRRERCCAATMQSTESILNQWFAAMTVGDSVGGGRNPTEATTLVEATFILGKQVAGTCKRTADTS